MPERKSVILSEKEDGTPTKTVIKTRIIKKIQGPNMEVTKVQTVEEYEKAPQTIVSVEKFNTPFPELPEERLSEVVMLPDEVFESEAVDEEGRLKMIKTKKRIIRKPALDNTEEVTEIGIIEQDNVEPIYSVKIQERPLTESKPEDSKLIELPEHVTELNVILPDGKKREGPLSPELLKRA